MAFRIAEFSFCHTDDADVSQGARRASTVSCPRLSAPVALTARRRTVLTMGAGLRTFPPDEQVLIGFDPVAPGWFWLAGQGGYGIQTAPATARLAAALVRGRA